MSAIDFEGVSLKIKSHGRLKTILTDVDFSFPSDRIALLSTERQNVAAVVDLLSRRLRPQRGAIRFRGSISWPIGHVGPFSIVVTGTQAISHFCALYGVNRGLAFDFLHSEFAAPDRLTKPLHTWSRDLQLQFMLLMSLVPQFDIYLVDGPIVMPNDLAFSGRFLSLFVERIRDRALIVTGRQPPVVRGLCQCAAVVINETLVHYHHVEEAMKVADGRGRREEDIGIPEVAEPESGFDELMF